MEYRKYCALSGRQLLSCGWMSAETKHLSPAVTNITEHFQNLSLAREERATPPGSS